MPQLDQTPRGGLKGGGDQGVGAGRHLSGRAIISRAKSHTSAKPRKVPHSAEHPPETHGRRITGAKVAEKASDRVDTLEPLLTVPPPKAAASSRGAICPPSTILLVEDDLLSQRVATMIFERAGHEVLVAESVAGGWDQLKRNPLVDLVVIDNHLGLESGWSLMGEIRRRSYLQNLPIIAYTGSRDREVVMRYAELKVQAFHLKPFRAEVLLAELERAHASGWRDRLWEVPAKACQRLKLTPEQYAGLLNSGAGLLEESCQTIRRLMISSGDPRVGIAFRAMAQQLTQLGVNIVERIGGQAQKELARGDYAACSETLGMIDSVAAQLRRRAMSKLDMGDAVVSGLTKATPITSAKGGEGGPARATSLPAYACAVLDRPIRDFGTIRTGGDELARPFPEGEFTAISREWARHPAAAIWLETLAWLDRVDGMGGAAMAASLEAIPGYDEIAEVFLIRTGVVAASRSGRADWTAVVNKVGIPKAGILAAAGRICQLGVSSPWPISPLRRHAVTMLLLGFELGRLLRLTYPHKIAAAALARNFGLWTTVLSAPLPAALAWAGAGAGGNAEETQRNLLGLTFTEAGAKWLALNGAEPLYVDIAAGRSAFAGSEVTNVVVDLVEQIARTVLLGESAAMDALGRELADSGHPIWEALRGRDTELPSDPSEIIDMVMPLARSAAWIAGEITLLRPAD